MWAQNGRLQDIQFQFAETADGYTVEVAVPWGNVSVVPKAGLLIGFEAEVNDTDGRDFQRDGKLAWFAEVDKAWSNPGLFGTAVLVEEWLRDRPNEWNTPQLFLTYKSIFSKKWGKCL